MTDVLGQALDAMDQLPAKQEEAFASAMGRKARGWKVMQPRGDASQAGIAGEYQRDRRARDVSATGDCKRRPASQGRLGGRSPRSGVAMTLTPKEGDATVVEKVVPSKARTVFTELVSVEAARHAVEQNQENFRFAFAPARRSSSVPQPQGQGGAGLTSTSNARRLHREVSTPRKPSLRFSDAGHVARALDREGGRHEVKAERSHRMQHEKAFAEICSFTKQSKQAMRKTSATIRSTFGSGQSSAMAGLLAQE